MLRRVKHGRPRREGATLEHVRWNEAIAHVAFGGRRQVYACIAALSGAQPGDRVLDIGCGGGYLARLLAVHHIPEAARPAAFGEMCRVLRPGGTLLVADFRPSGRRRTLHSFGSTARHGTAVPLDELAASAGFRVEARGELPLLRYIRTIRPDDTATA